MTELRLLRMESIFARSMPSTAAAESGTEGADCVTACLAATDCPVFEAIGVDTCRLGGRWSCSSTGEKYACEATETSDIASLNHLWNQRSDSHYSKMQLLKSMKQRSKQVYIILAVRYHN